MIIISTHYIVMPKRTYQLINPHIEGTFKDTYDAKEPIDAANSMWSNFTEHLVSHVPKFMFTMRDISSGDLHHFEVSENKQENQYTIEKLNLDINKKHFSDLAANIDNYGKAREQKGGHRRRYEDDSDSDSNSSTDVYPTIRRTSPIAMFHYNTRVYYTPLDLKVFDSTMNPQLVAVTTPVFTPVFKPSLGTFVGIWP
jgi:hypothetical protein